MELLKVLLTKKGEIGTALEKELRHHGRHAVEVSRAPRAAEPLADAADGHLRREARRVDFLGTRRIEEVDPQSLELGGIFFLAAGIGGQIRSVVELFRVDEERDDDALGAFKRGAHEAQMPLVKGPHGGNHRNTGTFLAPGRHPGAELRPAAHDGETHPASSLHRKAGTGEGSLIRSSSLEGRLSILPGCQSRASRAAYSAFFSLSARILKLPRNASMRVSIFLRPSAVASLALSCQASIFASVSSRSRSMRAAVLSATCSMRART